MIKDRIADETKILNFRHLLEVLGKERVLARIDKTLEKFSHR
jgi:hypothetical protein